MKILLMMFALLIGGEAIAQTQLNAYPFFPEVDKRFRKLEQKIVGKFIWDFNQQGGASSVAINLRPYYGSPTIPANAVVTRTYFVTKTAITAANTSQLISIGCNSLAAGTTTAFVSSGQTTYFMAAGASVDGTQTGASTKFYQIGTSACTPAIDFGGNPSSGYISGWIEYVVP